MPDLTAPTPFDPTTPKGPASAEQTLESIGDGVIVTDERGRVDGMNTVAEHLSMWTLDEARGRWLDDVFTVVNEDTGQVVPSRTEEVLRHGRVLGLPRHSAIRARDGTLRPIADSTAPIRDDQGRVRGAVVVFRDQTQERDQERALEASRAQIAAVLESSLDGVLVVDERGRIAAANRAAEGMFGRGPLVDRSFADLVSPPIDLRTEVHRERLERRGVRAEGRTFPVDLAIARIPFDGVSSYTCFVRDQTEAEAARRALTDSHAQLRSLGGRLEQVREEERTRIARELHDELGQQLTAIRMDLGWLAARVAGPEVVKRLAAVTGLVDSTFTMVRRLGAGLRPGILDDLGVAEAVEWQARDFQERFGIVVTVDTSGLTEPVGASLSTAIFRVFQEILTNVVRHAAAHRVIGRLWQASGQVTLEVRDDGTGIRADSVANPTSFGLLGMRERAALHGGSCTVGPLSGGGTLVIWSAPVEPSP